MPLSSKSALVRWLENQLSNFRYRLAHSDALPHLAILGCISGLVTGVIAVLFRLSFEAPLHILLGGNTDNFEALSPYAHWLLPLAGALLVGIILHFVPAHRRAVGVGHVVDRVHQHQGHFPSGNALVQFVCGSLLLSTGTPVGREGPAVHLGAAAASSVGQQLKLPNNNLRLLAGCGAAAAIAASFNTPLAGVIFAMEVVLMEYTISGFIPIILASVCGTIVSRTVYGDAPAFDIPNLYMASLWEVPYLIATGLAIGLFAAVTLRIHKLSSRLAQTPILIRALVAGLIAGSIGALIPEVLGLGYDTIEQALLGQIGLGLLITIGIAKMLVASCVVTLGLPGGMISPTLVSGACLGGAIGIAASLIFPDLASDAGFYAMLGMGAMMGALLNAPLAALIALMELTYSPGILMPAMLVIVIASITTRLSARLPGLFLIGRDPNRYSSPVFQMLSRAGVTSLMARDVITCPQQISWQNAQDHLATKPDWLVITPTEPSDSKRLMRPADLAHFIQNSESDDWESDTPIDLLQVPGQQRQIYPIHTRATLQEALLLMRQQQVEAVYVNRTTALPLQSDVLGVITREDIDNYYQ